MQKIKNIKTRKFIIYVLKDPNTLEVRYVGVTCTTLSARLSQHIYDSKKKGTYKRNWLQSLKKNNQKPLIEEVEICNYQNWEEREKYWIKYYSSKILTNTKEGGAGVVLNRSLESVEKSAQAKWIPVVAINFKREVQHFKSFKEASEITGVPKSSIEYSVTGINFSSYGYNFIRESEYQVGIEKTVKIKPKKHKYKIKHKEKEYTPTTFAKYLNLSETIVYLWCEGKQNWKNSYSYDGFDIEIIKI